MRVRFQADADLNQKILTAVLRIEPTIDFRTSHAANLVGIPDVEVLAIAASEGRVLVSHDKASMPDAFGEFILTRESPGVLIVRRGFKLASAAEDLVLIWSASEPTEWTY